MKNRDLLYAFLLEARYPLLYNAVHWSLTTTCIMVPNGDDTYKNYTQIFRTFFYTWDGRVQALHELLADIERTIASNQQGGEGVKNGVPFRLMSGSAGMGNVDVFWLRSPFILETSHAFHHGFSWVAELTTVPQAYLLRVENDKG